MRPRLVLAFAAVWFIWGSTYLAIRFAIETLPPWLMAGTRFVVAGALLYAWCRLRGAPRPARAEWKTAAIIGLLLPAIGNGTVVWSETQVPSGVVALLIATVPVWMLLLRWRSSASRPGLVEMAGVALGIAGVAILVSPHDGVRGGVSLTVLGVMLFGTLTWAAGSLYSQSLPPTRVPLLGAGMEMLCGGAMLVAGGVLSGEMAHLGEVSVSLKSVLSLAYLSIFGSLVAFSAYKYLLSHESPARAGSYAFVNPVVAVLLGWALAGEPLGLRTMAAMTVIVGAVVLITLAPGARVQVAEPIAE